MMLEHARAWRVPSPSIGQRTTEDTISLTVESISSSDRCAAVVLDAVILIGHECWRAKSGEILPLFQNGRRNAGGTFCGEKPPPHGSGCAETMPAEVFPVVSLEFFQLLRFRPSSTPKNTFTNSSYGDRLFFLKQ